MTTNNAAAFSGPDAPSRTPLLAALGLAAAAVLTAVATFWDLTGNSSRELGMSEFLGSLAIAAVATLLAFGLVVRTADGGHAARRSLITAVVALLSLAVFWSGIPAVLVAASVACALVEQDRRGTFSSASKAGLAISALTFAGAVVLAVVG